MWNIMKLKKNVLKVVVSLLLVLSMIVSPFFNIKAQADIKAGMENTDVTYAKIATSIIVRLRELYF